MTLQYLVAVHGAPKHLRSNNGPELIATEIQERLARPGDRTLDIQQASPCENNYVEIFNGRLQDELLARELFLSLPEAHLVFDQWTMDSNHCATIGLVVSAWIRSTDRACRQCPCSIAAPLRRMQSPLEFLDVFRGDLRAAGLRFAITSLISSGGP